jgi:hypothetical protein
MPNFDRNIGLWEKNANFFAENCQKSPKIVIITSTPGATEEIPVVAEVFIDLLIYYFIIKLLSIVLFITFYNTFN